MDDDTDAELQQAAERAALHAWSAIARARVSALLPRSWPPEVCLAFMQALERVHRAGHQGVGG